MIKPYETVEEEREHITRVRAVHARNEAVATHELILWPPCNRCNGGGYDPQAFGGSEQLSACCKKCGGCGRMHPDDAELF